MRFWLSTTVHFFFLSHACQKAFWEQFTETPSTTHTHTHTRKGQCCTKGPKHSFCKFSESPVRCHWHHFVLHLSARAWSRKFHKDTDLCHGQCCSESLMESVNGEQKFWNCSSVLLGLAWNPSPIPALSTTAQLFSLFFGQYSKHKPESKRWAKNSLGLGVLCAKNSCMFLSSKGAPKS